MIPRCFDDQFNISGYMCREGTRPITTVCPEKTGSNYMCCFMHSEYSFPYLFIGNLHSGTLSNIQVSNGYSCQKVQFKSALRMGGEPVEWRTRRATGFNQKLQSKLLQRAPIWPEFKKLLQGKTSWFFVCFIWRINMLRNNILIIYLWKKKISYLSPESTRYGACT